MNLGEIQMKKLFKVLFFLFLSIPLHICNAQYWVQQISGTNVHLNSVYFVNESTGFATGYTTSGTTTGVILRTTNGGINWYTVQTTTTTIGFVHFPSVNTGYVPSNDGFYKTTNSGINFVFTSSILNRYYPCFFTSNDTGYTSYGSNHILKTVNGGISWSQIDVYGLIKNIYFITSSTGFYAGFGSGGGLYRTTNDGLNWSLQYYTNNLMCLHFPSLTTGYCSGDTVLKTTNGGVNWFRLNSTNNLYKGSFGPIFFINNITGYLSGSSYIYKTTDGGNNWQSQQYISGSSINSIFFPSSSVGYAVGNNGLILKTGLIARLNDVYLYNDGRTQTHNLTLSDSSCIHPNGNLDSLWWYVNGVRVNPYSPQPQHNMTYNYKQGTTYVQLKIKDSNGLTDTTTAKVVRAVYLTKTNGPIKAGLSLIGDDFLYAISTGNAVYRMGINGDTLYKLQTAGNILSSCSISYDTCVYICSDNTNLYGFSKSGTPIWTLPVYLGAPATCTPTIDSTTNKLYLGVENNRFYAINRQTGNIAWFYDTVNSPIRNSAVISTSRKLVFASETGFIYGFDLNNLPSPPYPKWKFNLNDSVFTSPAIDAQGYFYFGTSSGKLVKVDLPASSTTGSIIWQATLSGTVTSSPTIDANGNIYCGTSDGNLYCVRSGGSIKWNFLTTGAVRSTAAITNYARLYFGNDAGEFFGLDTNKNVQFYYKDSSKISCAILYKNGATYLGTETGRLLAFYDTVEAGRGPGIPVWGTFQNNPRRTGEQRGLITNINQISENVPDKYELYQNYPNPFNPITNIKYQLPKTNYVVLKVYDILGKEIATLVNEKQSPGIYSVDFDGTIYASGVYFYKLQAGEFTGIKKMILLK